MEAPKRSGLRRQTVQLRTGEHKGFLKLAREKLMKQQTLLAFPLENDKKPKHAHKRSQSTNNSSPDSESPKSPTMQFIRKPGGDFGEYCDFQMS